MKHVHGAGLAVLVMVVILAGCEQETGGPADLGPTAPGSGPGKSDPEQHLATAWSDGETYQYDTVSGLVDIDTGGSFTARPESYPAGFAVSVYVPAGAVPSEWATDGEITITVKVPRFDTPFDSQHSPCPFTLEPHGIQFLEPITIWLVLPEGLIASCDPGYLFYNLVREIEGGVETFRLQDATRVYSLASELETAAPPGFQGDVVPGGCANMIRCQVLHFSRWELENEEEEDPDAGA